MTPDDMAGDRVRRWRWLLMVVGIAAVITVLLPPRKQRIDTATDIAAHVRGAIHVHTNRSDGSGSVDDVAAAAARAGLQFVVFSDHGDARRPAMAPSYRHGVLCIDAVEISSSGGHILAIGLNREAPYPLGGEPRDVIDDVRRLGGMSIVAHPTSGKQELQYHDWDANFDGIEWLNADSEWRDEGVMTLGRALLTYPWRRVETMAMLLDRPVSLFAQWDRLLRSRRVIAIAGADAHAGIGFSGDDNPYGDGALMALPDYEPSLKTFSVALPAARLAGDATTDARTVIDELRTGRVYSAIDGLATPARLRFSARSGGREAQGGESLLPEGPVTIEVATNAPSRSRIHLVRDGQVVAEATGAVLRHQASEQVGVYRTEVYLPNDEGAGVPWLVSNPIYVGRASEPASPAFVPVLESAVYTAEELAKALTDGVLRNGWGIEASDNTIAAPAASGTNLKLHFELRSSPGLSPYVAVGIPAGKDIVNFTRVAFRARASRPMRAWIQLWTTVPEGNQYWRRSVYLDEMVRDISIPFEEMLPSPPQAPRQVPLDRILTIMFAIDTVHTPLGTTGDIWIDAVRYQR